MPACSMTSFWKFVAAVLLVLSSVDAFLHRGSSASRRPMRFPAAENSSTFSAEETARAMEAARVCAAKGLSPGAGLATADEQAEAAYADLINTTVDQRGLSLTEDELKDLNKGGKMWEKGATTTVRKGGLLNDMSNLWKALAGGAHIEKNEFGET